MIRRTIWLTVWLLASISSHCADAQQTKPLQHIWEVQPDFGSIWELNARNRFVPFDVESLNSTLIQDRLQVAQFICLHYDNPLFQDRPRALELLLERLRREDEPLLVRRAMVSAACLLSDESNAKFLWEVAQKDPLMLATVEQALIRWKSPVASQAWRARLQDRHAMPLEVARAIDGLAVAGNAEDKEVLTEILCGNQTTSGNRFLAAKALGAIHRAGLNSLAQRVMDSDVDQRHLLAASLLQNHSSPETLPQLQNIMTGSSNAAQLIAGKAMAEHFWEEAMKLTPQMVAHSDNTMRELALQVLQQATDESSLRLQSQLVSDPNPNIRQLARTQLIEKASRGQRDLVDQCLTEILASKFWGGLEQAIIATVQLQDRSRCSRLVELLDHPRDEVNIHAGWALMELAEGEELMKAIHSHCEKVTARLESSDPTLVPADVFRISYLHEVFGRQRYEPAEELLKKYIPKNGFKLGVVSRASAIWTLGQLNSAKDVPDLRKKLCERVEDLVPFTPEDYLVRFCSVLALGEMAYSDSLASITKFGEIPPAPIGYAAEWACKRIDAANK